jgi:hypothetical protein
MYAVASALGPDRMTAFEYIMSNGGAAYDGAGSSQQQEQQQPAQQHEQPQQQPPPAVLAASISNASSEVGTRDSPIIKMPFCPMQQLQCTGLRHATNAKHGVSRAQMCFYRCSTCILVAQCTSAPYLPSRRCSVLLDQSSRQSMVHLQLLRSISSCNHSLLTAPYVCVCSWMGTG